MKKITQILFFLSIAILFMMAFSVQSQILEDDLLIYYSWNGDHLDHSGNEYDPAYFNAQYVPDRFGKDSSALYFNGQTDYIALPNNWYLKPPLPLSFAFWVKLDDLTSQHGYMFSNDHFEYAHTGVWMNLSSAQRLACSYGDGWDLSQDSRKSFLTDVHLEDSTWYYVAGVIHNVYDIRIFINGVEQTGYIEGSAYQYTYADGAGNIGRKDATYQWGPYYFKGYMDEFRYWEKGLSNHEVMQLYEEQTLSTEEKRAIHSITIYPNPATNRIHIKSSANSRYSITIINSIGKIVQMKDELNVIDVSFLPVGLYLIQIEDKKLKQTVTRRFIKK